MEGTFLDFFIYLVTNIHKDMNALIIVSFLVIVPTCFFQMLLLALSSFKYTSSSSSPFSAYPPLPGSNGYILLYLLFGIYYSTKL